jgi:uncharacterized protein DUF4232
MIVRRLSGSRARARARRGILALCALAAAVAAVSLASVPTAGAATPACHTGGLVIWMDTQGNGTAGTIFYTLNFTNLSGHTCTLRGFPGVSAVNLGGARIGRAAGRDAGQTVRTITLAAGHTAHATLGIVDTGALPNCRPTTASGLRVFPPNQTRSKVIPFPFSACRGSGPTFLRIRPVTR